MPLPPATWPAPRQLRELLALWRAQGVPFDAAWPEALGRLVRDPEWRAILERDREEWRKGYVREPSRLAALADVVPAEPGAEVPDEEAEQRLCAYCDGPILRADPRARYCSVQHRRAAERAISRAREDRRRELSRHPPAAAASSAQTPTAMEAHRAA